MFPPADSRYSPVDADECRIDTVIVESQLGLGIALFGEAVFVATVRPTASRLMAAVTRIIVLAVLMPKTIIAVVLFGSLLVIG